MVEKVRVKMLGDLVSGEDLFIIGGSFSLHPVVEGLASYGGPLLYDHVTQ